MQAGPHQYLSENKQLMCSKGYQHKNMPVMMICMDEKCKSKRLCCLTCIDELHCKHQLISIGKFQHFLKATFKIGDSRQITTLVLKKINEEQLNFKEKILTLKETMCKNLDNCLQKIDGCFKRICQSLNVEKYGNSVEDLFSDLCDDKVDYYYDLAFQVKKNTISDEEEAEKVLSDLQKKLSTKTENFLKQTIKSKEQIDKIFQSFTLGKITKKGGNWKFTQEYKAACLVLSNSNLNAKRGEGAGGYPIAVCSDPLTASNNQINLTITEQPANKGCWLGICSPQIVKNYNFQSCYGIGKGTYAIDQVGQNHVSAYSWSHHDPNFNSAPKVGFQFGVGDVINVKVNYEKGTVKFTKGEASYEQPIKLDIGEYHAFVGPTNLNDSLSIVN